jgi:hypothetical protein
VSARGGPAGSPGDDCGREEMKESRVGSAIPAGEFTIVPLERLSVERAGKGRRWWFLAVREPVGVVVHSRLGVHAIDIHGKAVPLGEYLREFRGLEDLLDSLSGPAEQG